MKGDSEERIIYRHGAHIAPRISPDGERILFHSKQGGEIGIWLTDLKGEEKERLCDGDQANWSSDGKKIIFRREGRIMEREMVSGKEKIVTPEGWFPCEFPSYLPDGRVIFVSSDKIFLMASDEKTAPELLTEADIGSAPECSPDGKKIAYQDGAHIYLMDLADRKPQQLTTAPGVQSWPVWSQDGRSICYCQSPEAFGPWDIYNMPIDSPQNVGLVVRDVEVSPDWNGSAPSLSDTAELKGHNINLWQTGGFLADRGIWKAIPIDGGQEIKGEIAVENDWLVFHISTKEGKISILSDEGQKTMELIAVDAHGMPATHIESIRVMGNDGENVVLRVELRSEDGGLMEVAFTIPRSRPFIEIEPSENIDKVYFKRDMVLALAPDRFADDLAFVPDRYSTSRILLPYSPFTIGFSEDSMVLIVTPVDEQKTWLVKDDAGESFEGMEVSTGGERFFVSLLTDERSWYQTKVTSDPETNEWRTKWSEPFLAQWRIAVGTERQNYSRMWDEEDLNSMGKTFFPIEQEFSEPPDLSVIYLYGRSWHTPLDVVTPMDVLQDALGVDRLNIVLDIEGIRTYRSAEGSLPLHTLLTSQENRLWPEDSSGWPKSLDFSPLHPLLVRIRMVEREGVESTAMHLCEDILKSLEGLDNRIEEYEKFLDELKESCEVDERYSPETVEFLNGVEQGIANLRSGIAESYVTEIGEISQAIGEIKGSLGTSDYLWDRNEFSDFWELSEAGLSERQEILTRYRDFVKRVRNHAGMTISKDAGARVVCEDVRELTQNILRNRYYLEGDWRGEEPLDLRRH
ncbi:hypothetical protein ACFL6S_07260 [Candidatus Poribacteria bacterium]